MIKKSSRQHFFILLSLRVKIHLNGVTLEAGWISCIYFFLILLLSRLLANHENNIESTSYIYKHNREENCDKVLKQTFSLLAQCNLGRIIRIDIIVLQMLLSVTNFLSRRLRRKLSIDFLVVCADFYNLQMNKYKMSKKLIRN